MMLENEMYLPALMCFLTISDIFGKIAFPECIGIRNDHLILFYSYKADDQSSRSILIKIMRKSTFHLIL